jgi:hypothetical protein
MAELSVVVSSLPVLVKTASRGAVAQAAAAGDVVVVEVSESEEVEAATARDVAVVEASCFPILIPHSSMRWDSLRISSSRSWATSGSMAAASGGTNRGDEKFSGETPRIGVSDTKC